MTNAVPFGVYIAPASIIRADIRERVSDGEWCYIQLLKRINDQAYSVHAASLCADIYRIYRDEEDESADENVFVSTITRQDLHMQCSLLSAPSAEQPLYIAPDCILKGKLSRDGEDLQLFASSAWLCYFRVLHVFDDGSVRVRVAALPHRVDGTVGRSYLTTLSRDEFVLALQSERKDLDMATCDLRAKVEAKAQMVSRRPVEHIHPQVLLDDEDQEVTAPKQAYPPEVLNMLRLVDHPSYTAGPAQQLVDEELLPEVQRPKTKALKPIFVPEIIAQQAIARFKEVTGKDPTSRKLQQKVWLQATLSTLRSYKERSAQKQSVNADIELQDQQVRMVLVNWLSSAVLLVEVVPVPIKKKLKKGEKPRVHGYVVRIEQPEEAA